MTSFPSARPVDFSSVLSGESSADPCVWQTHDSPVSKKDMRADSTCEASMRNTDIITVTNRTESYRDIALLNVTWKCTLPATHLYELPAHAALPTCSEASVKPGARAVASDCTLSISLAILIVKRMCSWTTLPDFKFWLSHVCLYIWASYIAHLHICALSSSFGKWG